MKRGIVCLLVCVLMLHACGSAPAVEVIDEAVSASVSESADTSETTMLLEAETTEATEPVGTTERDETTELPETTAVVHTSVSTRPDAAVSAAHTVSESSTHPTTIAKKTDYLLTLPSRAEQTSEAKKETTTAKPTTTSTRPSTTTTTSAYHGGSGDSAAPIQSDSTPSPLTPTGTRQPTDAQRPPKPTGTPQSTGSTALTCTLTISAKEIREHPEKLKTEEKLAFVPEDGYILKGVHLTFSEGETVYDVLRRACSTHPCSANCAFCQADGGKIQMESSYTPVYESYYVEGIHQLYEKDCGGTSGWTYYVNGVFPNYGSSQYKLKDGDRIEWVYSIEKDGLE